MLAILSYLHCTAHTLRAQGRLYNSHAHQQKRWSWSACHPASMFRHPASMFRHPASMFRYPASMFRQFFSVPSTGQSLPVSAGLQDTSVHHFSHFLHQLISKHAFLEQLALMLPQSN